MSFVQYITSHIITYSFFCLLNITHSIYTMIHQGDLPGSGLTVVFFSSLNSPEALSREPSWSCSARTSTPRFTKSL